MGEKDFKHAANKSGNYSVEIIDKTCSFSTDSKSILFSDALQVHTLGNENTLCGGNTIVMHAITELGGIIGTDSERKIIWQKNQQDLAIGNTELYVTQPGIYRFQLTQGNCKSYSDNYEISNGPKLEPAIVEFNYESCLSQPVRVGWFGQGAVFNNQNLIANNVSEIELTGPGNYSVIRDFQGACQSDPTPIDVSIGTLSPNITTNKENLCGQGDLAVLYYENQAFYSQPFNLQWEKDGEVVSNDFVLVARTPGSYRLKVTSGNCSEYSNTIVITRNDNLVMDITPIYNKSSSNLECKNRFIELTVSHPVLTNLQWYRDGEIIENKTEYIFRYPQTGSYTLTATGNGCNATSNPFVVNSDYVPQPVLAQSPTQVGASATLTASACNGTVNWYDAATGGNLLGTGTSFTTPNLSSTQPYYAYCTTTACKSARERIDVVLDGCTSMYTLRSGSWYEPTTWSCGRIPIASDQITINAGHEVSITYGDPTIKTLQHAGGLMLKNNARLTLVE